MTQEAGKQRTVRNILMGNAAGWLAKLPPEAIEDFMDAMEEYAHQREQPWVRVEDEMPDFDQYVLACISITDGDDVIHTLTFNHRGWLIQRQHGFPEPLTTGTVTHWMNIPGLPNHD